jgi:hypothetical protein
LDPVAQAPNLLKEALEVVDDSNEFLHKCADDVIVEGGPYQSQVSGTAQINIDIRYKISVGDYTYLVADENGKGIFIPAGTSVLVRENSILKEINLNPSVSLTELNKRMNKTGIILNRHGIYTSFRAIFARSMMTLARGVLFTKGGYTWRGFQSLFEDSISWIRDLEHAIHWYSVTYATNIEDACNLVATDLSTLGLSAKDPDYIKGWWSNYEELTTDYGVIRLYGVEHPKSIEDLRKIHSWLNHFVPNATFSEEDIVKCYVAAIFMQSFRRSLLKQKVEGSDPSLRELYRSFEREKEAIIGASATFQVSSVFYVRTTREMAPFKVLENYADYADV